MKVMVYIFLVKVIIAKVVNHCDIVDVHDGLLHQEPCLTSAMYDEWSSSLVHLLCIHSRLLVS